MYGALEHYHPVDFPNGKLWIQKKTLALMPVTMARIVQLQEKLVTTKIDYFFMRTSHEG